jgi:hypothetical protein
MVTGTTDMVWCPYCGTTTGVQPMPAPPKFRRRRARLVGRTGRSPRLTRGRTLVASLPRSRRKRAAQDTAAGRDAGRRCARSHRRAAAQPAARVGRIGPVDRLKARARLPGGLEEVRWLIAAATVDQRGANLRLPSGGGSRMPSESVIRERRWHGVDYLSGIATELQVGTVH